MDVWQSKMGGAWGKLRYELQQSGGNRAQVRARDLPWGFMEIVQGLMMVEEGVGIKRSTLVGIQSHLPCEGCGEGACWASGFRQCEWLQGIGVQKELSW